MKKIISLFKRNYEGDSLVFDEIVPGAEWVIAGEGLATRKYDGTCCMVKDGMLYKRYDVKRGRKKPDGFIPAQEPDQITGHWPGWIKVGDGPEDKWHREAYSSCYPDGTYELCGPKINANPERFDDHRLILHGAYVIYNCPRDYEGLKKFFSNIDMEGIVWHHPDGRMVKLKIRDFGFKRKRRFR